MRAVNHWNTQKKGFHFETRRGAIAPPKDPFENPAKARGYLRGLGADHTTGRACCMD
jgi:hypothetical protein